MLPSIAESEMGGPVVHKGDALPPETLHTGEIQAVFVPHSLRHCMCGAKTHTAAVSSRSQGRASVFTVKPLSDAQYVN